MSARPERSLGLIVLSKHPDARAASASLASGALEDEPGGGADAPQPVRHHVRQAHDHRREARQTQQQADHAIIALLADHLRLGLETRDVFGVRRGPFHRSSMDRNAGGSVWRKTEISSIG